MKKKAKLNIIPDMPPAIIDAIQENRLVLFVGAGVSALLGLPLWDKLSNDLVSLCREQGLMSRSEEETLLHSNYSSVQKLSIAVYLLDDNAKVTGKDGKDWIIENLRSPADKELIKRADKISYLLSKYKSAILTTNADIVLDNASFIKDRSINKTLEECPDGYLNPNSFTHIHGSILDKNTLVFTSADYAEKYINTSSFGELLQLALKSKTVLFIGYGVNEFELIRYFLDAAKGNEEYTLFKLDGYYKKDSYKIELDRKYLEKLRIKLLDYSLEKKGYDALIDVLVAWDKKIDKELNPESKVLDEVSTLLSELPKIGTKERIDQLLKNHEIDLRYFSVELCNSNFFVKWLECLVNSKELFDVKTNFEYPIETEEGRYKSGSWYGATILSNYANLKIENKKIDSLIIDIIKNSYNLIKSDQNEKELLKRRSASFGIMQTLVSIILSRPIFFNINESFEFISTYLSVEKPSPYMFIEELFGNADLIKEANKESLFKIVKSLLSIIDEDYLFSKMKSRSLEFLLRNNPKQYFMLGIEELFKDKNDFYTMGSFFEYENEEMVNPKERFCIYLINTSAKYIPLNELKNTIKKSFTCSNETKNKMALSLMSIRLLECTELFYKLQKKIFNTQYLYSDLESLIKRNINALFKDNMFYEKLINLCKTSSFGFEDSKKIKLLRTNLLNIFSTVDSKFTFKPLNTSELFFVRNINKRVYSIPYDSKNETKIVFDKIKDLSIDDAINVIETELAPSSRYYESRLFEALDLYLKDKPFDDYYCHLKSVSYKYVIHYLYKLCEHIYSAPNDDLKIVSKIIEIIDDAHYNEMIPALLYALEKAYDVENGKNKVYEKTLLKIKYKRITLEEAVIENEAINVVINTNLHTYMKLLINYSIKAKRLYSLIDDVFSYFYDLYNNSLLFRAIIAHFYPFLLYFNKQKYSQLFLYLFDGVQSNVCYETLAYSRNVNKEILKQLSETEQFRAYLFDDSKDKMYVKRNYATYYINEYISRNNFEQLAKDIISDPRFISSIEDVVRWGSEDLKNSIDNPANYDKLFYLCNKSYSVVLKASYEVDQLIRFLSEYIVLSGDKSDEAWRLLVVLSKQMKSYFSDEYKELIATFKNTREKYIVELVNNFVDIYEKYTFSESTIVEIINMLSSIEHYHRYAVSWKRKLLKKDPFLNNLFTKHKS